MLTFQEWNATAKLLYFNSVKQTDRDRQFNRHFKVIARIDTEDEQKKNERRTKKKQ